MIYVTGDTHGEVDICKLSRRNWPEEKMLTENDFLVILGDFGFPFFDKNIMEARGYMREYQYWTQWLAKKPYTILFIDGNHDNFNFWDSQPITEKWGGKVQHHPDIPNAYRLMRGEIYEINGKKIFTFGGAVSTDKISRIKDVSWWEQEQATNEQIEYARKNLAAHNNTVDYIFTHTMPQEIIRSIGYLPIPDNGAEYFDEVLHTVNYKIWACGHFHRDGIDPDYRIRLCYKDIENINITEQKINTMREDEYNA